MLVKNRSFSLFNFSLECAKLSSDTTFIWRLHPSITFTKIRAVNSQYDQLPKNIILSDKELDEDIIQCQFALYRGSTAILKAVCAGVTPIYYKKNREVMTIDPLYRINEGKIIISDPNQFLKQTAIFNGIKESSNKKAKIMKYCNRYYDPIDPTFLLNFDKT